MTANTLKRKISLRIKRKRKIRANISGSAVCPRISIFKSNRTIYAQAIDDTNSKTLCASSGTALTIKANTEGAALLAKDFAEKLKAAKISEAIFDRNGYLYHGVVAAFADALRKNGIKL